MKEHCHKTGATDEFTAPSYRITTTPQHEWAVVVDDKPLSNDHRGHGRILHGVEVLLASELAIKAKLTRPEVIALVLYTGPMVCVRHSLKLQV